jgi:cytochrome b pre-mRNA-processing protein 3
MPILSRLFAGKPDPREALRPLWHRVVEISREPEWYATCGVADSVAGRFDMITAVLALVLLRLERDGASARESGIGDLVVGKHIGKLMAALGGRLGAYRAALAEAEEAGLEAAVARNVTLLEGHGPEALARRLRTFAGQLGQLPTAALLGGVVGR